MIYETELLNPVWWVNSLFGNATLLIVLIEIWLLSFIRRIPNITSFAIILMGINGVILIFGIFGGEGLTLSQSLLGLMLVIFGIIAWSSYNDS